MEVGAQGSAWGLGELSPWLHERAAPYCRRDNWQAANLIMRLQNADLIYQVLSLVKLIVSLSPFSSPSHIARDAAVA